MNISTKNEKFTLKMATSNDAELIVQFINKLAKFQKMEQTTTVTPERIKRLLDNNLAEVVLGYYEETPVAFSYFHQRSSAFTGRSGLYIDNFLIDDSMRGKGLGNIMFQFLSKYAVDSGCELLEWGCLDWNKKAIEFYEKQGAYCIDIMKIYRLSPEKLLENGSLFLTKE